MIVQLTYFKPSGKFYTSTEWEVRDGMLHHHVVSKFQGLAGNDYPGEMPGLASAGWEGFVHLQVGDVPHILVLRRTSEQVENNRR